MSQRLAPYLFGRQQDHLHDLADHNGVQVHREVIDPLGVLIRAAQQEGFRLRVASGFRGFERQRLIWNNKCLGLRPVLDSEGCPLDITQLTALEKITAILRWSALPGASRHHWGTECDIYDAAAVDEQYQLQLHPDEYNQGGPFAPMMEWLAEYLNKPASPDFYRPYLQDYQGIAPELWHISYRPIAKAYEQQLSLPLLREHLCLLSGGDDIEEKATLLENLDTIYKRFIQLPNE